MLLALAWSLPAWYAREPWKADEAYSFGLVWSMLRHGDWLVPTLAGEPFMEKPPLVFWLGAACAWLAHGWLAEHVAARGADLLLSLAAFALLAHAARRALGDAHRWLAPLLLAGSPAFLVASRYLIADVGLVPAAALGCVGFVGLACGARCAGVALGAGAAMGLMSKGVLLPGAMGIACALLPMVHARYRSRAVLAQLAIALVVFAALGLAWPLALWRASPELLWRWLIDNNLDRFVGANQLGPARRWDAPLVYAAFLLPAWLPALGWALRERRRLAAGPLAGVALFTGVLGAALLVSATARPIYALPLLAPLALLGAAGLRARIVRGDRWTALIVLAATAVMSATIAWRASVAAEASLGRDAGWQPGLAALSLAAWATFVVAWRRGVPVRPLQAWAAALACSFALAVALVGPAADARARYREVFAAVGAAVPANADCLASLGLGESERGLLEYYAGLLTRRIEIDAAAAACPRRIEQERVGLSPPAEYGCPGRRIAWQGHRLGHPEEVFRVCVAGPPAR